TGPIEPEAQTLRVPPAVRPRPVAKPQRERPPVQAPRGRTVPPRSTNLPPSLAVPPVVMEVIPVVEVPRSEAAEPPIVREATPAPMTAAILQETPSSVLAQLSALLSTRENLQAALVLQQILGRPVCERMRHGH